MKANFLTQLAGHRDRKIISDEKGSYLAQEIFSSAYQLSAKIPNGTLQVAVLARPGIDYVSGLFATWMKNAMCVPLCPEHPPAEMEYVISDSEASVILCSREWMTLLPPTKIPVVCIESNTSQLTDDYPVVVNAEENALMLYTSGTTGKPKGVVHTHASLAAQVQSLVTAWEWTNQDHILHFLPLHHTHGIVNKLLCPLWVGAHCEMLNSFDAKIVWEKIAEENSTIFMAVPTVYSKLVQCWEEADQNTKAKWTLACKKFRVMISGSAALPVTVLEKWKSISGHVLLERYGMTEIGMALSNPLHGERKPGFVGQQLPGIEVIVDDKNERYYPGMSLSGELLVKGKNMFKEYWCKPEETKKSFTADGWFRTGDMVAFEKGSFRIVGRLSTDIIKCGGYKISALEIESVLLAHPAVSECSVVGIPDEVWGEKIGAAVVLKENQSLNIDELREWGKEKLAGYKLPSLLKTVDKLPRNVMGKAVKGEVKKLFS